MAQRVAFGELLPDQPAFGNPGLVAAVNVVPIAGGYMPVGDFSASVSGTLAGDCIGAASFRSSGGVTVTIAGTTSNLYRYTSSGWSSVGAGYTGSALIGWRFRAFGDLIIAVNGVDSPKKLDMSAGSPSFSNLGGSPPVAELIAIVRDFVVLGRVGGDKKKIQWSAVNNSESWTVGTNLADFQLMPTGGDVVAIVGGEYGLILQEHRLVRMAFVGGIDIFQFDEVTASIGCIAANSVAQVGQRVYFLSHQGPAMYDPGAGVVLIGDEKVSRTMLDEIDRAYLPYMSVTVDPRNSLIIWAIPNATEPTKLYLYNYSLNRWATATQTVQRLFQGLTESVTLEDLDATYASIDAMTASLDDPQWKGGYPLLALIDGDRKLGTLSGVPKAATWTTGYMEPAAPMRTRLREAMPLIDTVDGLTLTVRGKNRLGDDAAEATYTTLNRRGSFNVRANWKYLQLSLTAAAGTSWRHGQGLDIEFEPGGR